MIFHSVEISKTSSVGAGRGVYTGKETIIGDAYMAISPASASIIYSANMKGQNASHEAWLRKTDISKQININDVVTWEERKLRVVTYTDEGKLNGKYLHLVLNEDSVRENRT